MRKIKKINGFLVVKFNDREKREYEGTALGEYLAALRDGQILQENECEHYAAQIAEVGADRLALKLYPFLHALEDKGLITSYTQMENGRERRFYHLTHAGQGALREKEDQWGIYTRAMARILGGVQE